MTNKRFADEMTAEELFSLATQKLREKDRDCMTTMELGLEAVSKHLMGSELQRQLEMPESPPSRKCPKCGQRASVRARKKARTLRTLAGEVTYHRDYYYCDGCRCGFFPRDLELGIPEKGELSSEVERRIIDFGMNDPDACAAERFNMHYSASISANQVRKALARTGHRLESCSLDWLEESLLEPATPTTNEALIVQTDGGMISTLAGWKEAKLGVIHSHKDRTSRDQPKPRYVCRLGAQQYFEDALEEAISAHTTDRPEQIVWLGDGAPGYWSICKRLAPDAVEILDWYHAMEHAADCAKSLFSSRDMIQLFIARIESLLWQGKTALLEAELEASQFLCDSELEKTALKDLLRYYRANAHRMNYAFYRQNGWPIGSGRVESAHKHVVQQRMKRAGQHWSIRRAKTMLRLRAAYSTAGPHKFYRAIENAELKSKAA